MSNYKDIKFNNDKYINNITFTKIIIKLNQMIKLIISNRLILLTN